MNNKKLDPTLILKESEIQLLLHNEERAILECVKEAYLLHEQGKSSLPHSQFLQFPELPLNRIIALPAYLKTDTPVAGIKWIASFPGNISQGLPRATATLILNSLDTGHPIGIFSSAAISAKRTAASAALAAQRLTSKLTVGTVGVVGCGTIGYETIRFLETLNPALTTLNLLDTNPERAQEFADRCYLQLPSLQIHILSSFDYLFETSDLVVLTTTALQPHIRKLPSHGAKLILHLSLRDLEPTIITSCVNIVDDVEHICKADTSIDRACKAQGDRSCIHATLGYLLSHVDHEITSDSPIIFNPFGLGILDLAVATLVRTKALNTSRGIRIDNFSI